MITEVTIPQVNANITEATVMEWVRKEGDVVARGEKLVELSTEKANVELEAPAAGTLRRIVAREKSIVPVGFIIALIGDPADPLPDADAANAALMAGSQERRERVQRDRPRRREGDPAAPDRPREGGPAAPKRPGEGGAGVRATPVARRLARELGLDLAAVAREAKVEVVTEALVRAAAERRG